MAITSIVQQDESVSSAQTITLPADIAPGDMIVLVDYAKMVLAMPATVVPGDFATLDERSGTITGGSAKQIISCKIADGSEASASRTGMNATGSNFFMRKLAVVFRPDSPLATINPVGWTGVISALNPGSVNVTSGSGAAPLLVLAAYGSHNGTADSVIDPRTFTVSGGGAKDGEVANSTTLYLAWKIFLSSPANVLADMDDEGSSNVVQLGYIEVAEGGGGGGSLNPVYFHHYRRTLKGRLPPKRDVGGLIGWRRRASGLITPKKAA